MSQVDLLNRKIKSKKKITGVLLAIEGLGFLLFVIIDVLNELLDIPHNIFKAPKSPVNKTELIIELSVIFILAVVVILITLRYVKRIRYLEGFLPVCSFCKRIRVKDNWIQIEEYITDHSEVVFSHSLCPDCLTQNYGFINNEENPNSESDKP